MRKSFFGCYVNGDLMGWRKKTSRHSVATVNNLTHTFLARSRTSVKSLFIVLWCFAKSVGGAFSPSWRLISRRWPGAIWRQFIRVCGLVFFHSQINQLCKFQTSSRDRPTNCKTTQTWHSTECFTKLWYFILHISLGKITETALEVEAP